MNTQHNKPITGAPSLIALSYIWLFSWLLAGVGFFLQFIESFRYDPDFEALGLPQPGAEWEFFLYFIASVLWGWTFWAFLRGFSHLVSPKTER